MELLVPILDRVKAIWQLFDLERQPPMLLNRLVYLKQQMAELQRRLDETQRRADEKDEQIAKLQDIVAVKDDLITNGAAYYIKKDSDTLDGPFCASCFRHSHVMVRIASASHEEGPDGQPLTPIQCLNCRTPFALERSEDCSNSSPAAATNGDKKKSQKSTRKTSTKTRTRRPKSREKQLEDDRGQ